MKKYFLRLMFAMSLFATFTTFTSCSDDDLEDLSISDATHFSPPSWIQGKWADELSETYEFEFTSTDYLEKFGNIVNSTNKQINFYNVGGQSNASVIEEVITEDRYMFKIVYMTGPEVHYDFRLNEDGSIYDANKPSWEYVKLP